MTLTVIEEGIEREALLIGALCPLDR